MPMIVCCVLIVYVCACSLPGVAVSVIIMRVRALMVCGCVPFFFGACVRITNEHKLTHAHLRLLVLCLPHFRAHSLVSQFTAQLQQTPSTHSIHFATQVHPPLLSLPPPPPLPPSLAPFSPLPFLKAAPVASDAFSPLLDPPLPFCLSC